MSQTRTYVRLYSPTLNREWKVEVKTFEVNGGLAYYKKYIKDTTILGEITE